MISNYVKLTNLKEAGKLVRKWACDPAENAKIKAIANDPVKTKVYLAQNGIAVLQNKEVVFVQDTDTRMHIRIPHHSKVLNFPNGASTPDPHANSATKPGGDRLGDRMVDYPYGQDQIKQNYQTGMATDENKVQPDFTLNFHVNRLADYTFSHCY